MTARSQGEPTIASSLGMLARLYLDLIRLGVVRLLAGDGAPQRPLAVPVRADAD